MFLQAEKETEQRTDANANPFNFPCNHNVAQFKELVQSKYPQTFEIAEPIVGAGVDTGFNKYLTSATYEAPTGPPMKYYNDSNPIPEKYRSFKPQIFDNFYAAPRSDADEALLQKIDEVQVYEPKETVQEALSTGLDRDVDSEAYLKLNTKGIIACITFIAVTLLILTLVIINAVSIGSSRIQIRRLREENTELTQKYSDAELARIQAYNNGEARARIFANSGDAIVPEHIILPPLATYPLAPANSDSSTNVFNEISKFFGRIFG